MIGWSLEMVLDPSQELYRLAAVIDWAALEAEFGKLYCPHTVRPGVPNRLMAGLHFLKHVYALSDEEVVRHWVQNPYDQYFCGEEYFQHKLPSNPSQMTKWRKRIGEAGCEKLLKLTIDGGKRTKTITERSIEKVIVDTTVQPKAVAHPTDARLYRKVHAAMISIAKSEGVELRQSFTRTVRNEFSKHARYAKAKQFKRARKVQKHLKTLAGRVMREAERATASTAGRCCSPNCCLRRSGNQEQAVQPACARSRVHREGKSAPTLRIRREGELGCDPQRGFHRGPPELPR